jgi:predicted PurR-regulated permease PerM
MPERDRKGRPILQQIRTGAAQQPSGWGWTAVAVFVGLVLATLLVAVLALFGRTLALFVLGLAIAAALSPIVSRLERRIPRTVAIVFLYLLILLAFALIVWTIFPAFVEQGEELVHMVPEIADFIQGFYEQWGGDVPIFETLFAQMGQVLSTLVAVPLGLASAFVQIFLVLFISLYSLIELPKLRRFIGSLFPPGRRERVDGVMMEMANAMGGYVRGSVIVAILVGIITYLGLTIIGVRFSLVLGLIAGVFELLPYIGPIIAVVPMLLVALLESPTQALIVLVFFVVLQQLESNVFVPNIMHTQTEISPLLAVLAIVAGGTIGGLLGALVAIPLAAALQVFVARAIAPLVRSQTGADKVENTQVKEEKFEAVEESSSESEREEA